MFVRPGGPASSLALGVLSQCPAHPVILDEEVTLEPHVITRPSRGHCSNQPGAHSPGTYLAVSSHGRANGAGSTSGAPNAGDSWVDSCASSVSAPPIAANSNAGGVAASRPPQLKEKRPRFCPPTGSWVARWAPRSCPLALPDEVTGRAAKSFTSLSHFPPENLKNPR